MVIVIAVFASSHEIIKMKVDQFSSTCIKCFTHAHTQFYFMIQNNKRKTWSFSFFLRGNKNKKGSKFYGDKKQLPVASEKGRKLFNLNIHDVFREWLFLCFMPFTFEY